MGKILLNAGLHRLVLFIIAYLVTKHQLDKDVADKLMRGDTVSLWNGGAPISVHDIVSYGAAVVIPGAISWLMASWRRIKDKFLILAASRMNVSVSQEKLKEVATQTPNLTIIKTVSNAEKHELQNPNP
jgi:hypothetical protein